MFKCYLSCKLEDIKNKDENFNRFAVRGKILERERDREREKERRRERERDKETKRDKKHDTKSISQHAFHTKYEKIHIKFMYTLRTCNLCTARIQEVI